MAVVRTMTGCGYGACRWGDAALRMAMAHGTFRMTGGSKRSMAVSGPEWHMAMDGPHDDSQETWGRGGWMYAIATRIPHNHAMSYRL